MKESGPEVEVVADLDQGPDLDLDRKVGLAIDVLQMMRDQNVPKV